MHAKRDAVSRPGKAMVKPGSGGLMILEHTLELSQNKDMQKPGTAIIPVRCMRKSIPLYALIRSILFLRIQPKKC